MEEDWLVGELIILFSPHGEELRNLILNNRAAFLMSGEVRTSQVGRSNIVLVNNCWLNSINAVKIDT